MQLGMQLSESPSLSSPFCLCLPVCLSLSSPFCLSVYLSICLSVYLSICLSVYLSVCLSVCLSVSLSLSLSLSLARSSAVVLSAAFLLRDKKNTVPTSGVLCAAGLPAPQEEKRGNIADASGESRRIMTRLAAPQPITPRSHRTRHVTNHATHNSVACRRVARHPQGASTRITPRRDGERCSLVPENCFIVPLVTTSSLPTRFLRPVSHRASASVDSGFGVRKQRPVPPPQRPR